ncbi:MAG: S24/S26 family peptidase [Bacteroidia bacterium]|nr:S24/S26 family peptidase [Bacteroidia bacterium]
MEKISLPNTILFDEVTRLLSEGREVIVPTKGSSMLPFIRGERDSVVLLQKLTFEPGDIVLALVDKDRYVLHRIWSVDQDAVTLMGDGNLCGKEQCSTSDISGTVTHIVKPDGHRISVETQKFRRRSRIWRKLLPLRRYILAVYKRMNVQL